MRPMDHHCPTCHAKPGERCRTTTTGRVTDIHAARWESKEDE